MMFATTVRLLLLAVVLAARGARGFLIGSASSSWRLPLGSSPTRLRAVIEVPAEIADDPRRSQVLSILSSIVDPDAGKDIVSAGLVSSVSISKSNDLQVTLSVSNVNSLMAQEVKNLCVIKLTALDWLGEQLEVSLVPVKAPSPAAGTPVAAAPAVPPALPNGLAGVKHVIAVSSCKGGVGKSTVSVNLAYTLSQMGYRVGIMDADIYGPSLPTMTKPASTQIMMQGQQMLPLSYRNVSLMSMGFINRGASIMRGPMVNQILTQFVSLTAWGSLDYLVIDMPPGTGDIQLTLAQIVNISAAVIVTTPQRLSFVDVVKGVDLFDTVNVPCVAVVENMADYSEYSFDDEFYSDASEALVQAQAGSDGGASARAAIEAVLRSRIEQQKQPSRLFGRGHSTRLRDMWGIDSLFSLPLLQGVSASGDSGKPFVAADDETEGSSAESSGIVDREKASIKATFQALASSVVKEIARLDGPGGGVAPSVEWDKDKSLVTFSGISASASSLASTSTSETGQKESGAKQALPASGAVSPLALRLDCRCAVCREETTGQLLLDPLAVDRLIKPLGMAPIGRYAVSVDWSDGHKSLFPYRQLARLAAANAEANANVNA